ncbi:restriction endonuclease [Brevundimonas sp. LjRoot202]|uniref:restriction endonuclease n=1 Tax=Brevundimonas sp. LjRoot202 TaxID=3342281 RepID=UPI003ED0FD66
MAEQIIWGIHAGKTGDAESLFTHQNCVAVGWPAMGDLSGLKLTREAFKARYSEVFPTKSAGHVPVAAGQLFRFVQEIKPGDLVVFPAKLDRTVRIGRVTGGYAHRPDASKAYPNQRSVEWLKSFPRTKFSQGALYEIGSALSLFQVKNFADEFRAALTGEAFVAPVSEDEAVAAVVMESEQSTEDFVLKRLAHEFKGHALEHFVAHLLEAMGFRARVTKKSGDGGVDIIAHKDALGLEPPIIKVQVKSTEGSIGEPEVKQLKGNLSGGEKGLLVTLGTISPKAELFARTVPDIRLIDGENLVKLILEHYEQFDSRYRAAVPLKRVYLPAPPEGEGA